MKKVLVLSVLVLKTILYCFSQTCGTTILCTQVEVDAVNCSTVNGGLSIGHPNTAICGNTNINSLNHLTQITSIKDWFQVANNPSLVSLGGMENIISIGDNSSDQITFSNNVVLTDILALNGVNNFTIGSILFSNNGLSNLILPNNLTSFSGSGGQVMILDESNLTTVDFNNLNSSGNVTFRNCPLLNSIDGSSLINLNNKAIVIDDLPALNSLSFSGLNVNVGSIAIINVSSSLANMDFTNVSNLTYSIGKSLEVDNTGLDNMVGFSGLETVSGEMYVTNNTDMTSLDGFENITSINNHMVIHNNPKLNDCCAIWGLIDNGGIGGNTILSGNGVNCNSITAIQAACAVLPVDLIEFKAEKMNDNSVWLNWTTAREFNNFEFELQKSDNGRNWQIMGSVVGKANTNNVNEYRYQDKAPYLGRNYYRIKQVDFDGKSKYSMVISVFSENNDQIKVFPNPTHGVIQLNMMNNASYRIVDLFGKVIKKGEIREAKLDISDLLKGIYILQIEDKYQQTAMKIIKE